MIVNLFKTVKGLERVKIKKKKNRLFIAYAPKKGKIRYLQLPKTLALNKNSFVACGLYNGEGYHSKGNSGQNSRITFTNSQLSYHKIILNWFEKLGQSRDKFALKLSFPEQKLSQENYFKSMWSSELGIKKFCKSGVIKGLSIVGTIYYNSSIFRMILEKIVENIRKVSTSKQLYASYYFSGLFAAEGSIWLGKRGFTPVNRISFNPFTEKELKEHYKNCIKKLGIRNFSEDKERGFLTICGILNTWTLLENGIFDLRNKNLVKSRIISADHHLSLIISADHHLSLSESFRRMFFNEIDLNYLHRKLNVSISTIYDWKNGKYSIPKNHFLNLCKLKKINPFRFQNEIKKIIIANQTIDNPPIKFIRLILSD